MWAISCAITIERPRRSGSVGALSGEQLVAVGDAARRLDGSPVLARAPSPGRRSRTGTAPRRSWRSGRSRSRSRGAGRPRRARAAPAREARACQPKSSPACSQVTETQGPPQTTNIAGGIGGVVANSHRPSPAVPTARPLASTVQCAGAVTREGDRRLQVVLVEAREDPVREVHADVRRRVDLAVGRVGEGVHALAVGHVGQPGLDHHLVVARAGRAAGSGRRRTPPRRRRRAPGARRGAPGTSRRRAPHT